MLVQNIGDVSVDDIQVQFYGAEASASLHWPADWMPQIGTAIISSLPAGRVAAVSVPWTPTERGRDCFLARREAADDRIVFDDWAPFDNNVCQKNVRILEEGISSTEVGIGNPQLEYGYGSVRMYSRDFPSGGRGSVKFTDPELFQRWRQAGGTVSGGDIISDTYSVQLGVRAPGSVTPGDSVVSAAEALGEVDMTIERIPFEGEEVSSLEFVISSPPGSNLPILQIEQKFSDRPIGGFVLRPSASIHRVHLPLIGTFGIVNE